MQALIESFAWTEDRMRTYLQSKDMAKSLRESLAAKNIALSHGECLEIVARQFGFADWNILAAKIGIESTPPAGAAPVELEPVPGPLAPGRWQFDPERRAAGPWMILGRDGDWNRMRPMIWNVLGKDDSLLLGRFQPLASGALATAVCIADEKERTVFS